MLKSILAARSAVLPGKSADPGLLPPYLFMRTLTLERKRAERSGRSFVLMIVHPGRLLENGNKEQALAKLLGALHFVRDTDVTGWYNDGAIGVIFTEIGAAGEKSAAHTICSKLTDALFETLSIEEINEIRLSFHVFPEDWDKNGRLSPVTATLHLALARELSRNRTALPIKRIIDIAGSLAALVGLFPFALPSPLPSNSHPAAPCSSARCASANMAASSPS